jgi:hypothetical protein
MSPLVLALALVALAAGRWPCVAEPPASDARVPSLERCEDIEVAMRPLGFAEVHVYQWRGGVLEGWIQLQDKDGKNQKEQLELARAAKVLFSKGQSFDPKAIRGAIIIAVKSSNDKSKARECIVTCSVVKELETTADGQKARERMRLWLPGPKGMIPAEGEGSVIKELSGSINDVKRTASYAFTPVDGKEFILYELRVK